VITKESIESVKFYADIVTVAENHGMKLVKKGKSYATVCPFHDDHDPSMRIYPETGTFHCFVCGAHGDTIDLHAKGKNCDFNTAVKDLAKSYGVEVIENLSPEAKEREERTVPIFEANELAAQIFNEQLKGQAKEYAEKRFNKETIKTWQIGYAEDDFQTLHNKMKEKGISEETMLKAGLIKESDKGRRYDTFRGRLMFPIKDTKGRIIGFSGRDMTGAHNDKSSGVGKYVNTEETETYRKREALMGIDKALKAIRKYDVCIIVEGNADVIHMHQIGINNTVAACGTSLTEEQVKTISRFTRNIAILFDNDEAGKKRSVDAAKMINQKGMNVVVLTIPKGKDGKKEDPDTYFKDKEQFKKFYNSFKKNYWTMLAELKKDNCENDSTYKINTIKEISSLFVNKPQSEIAAIVDELAAIIPTKTLWNKAIREIREAEELEKKRNEELEKEKARNAQQNETYTKYGFYEKDNCYWFHNAKGEGMFKGSNFVLRPLFHIESTINAKRLYEITNVYGVKKVIEFPQKDLISVPAFKLRCESLGNFLFDGGELGLSKIKQYLYEKTQSCKEITQLGWQKEGFFAWSNGIVSDGEFKATDENGIARHRGQNYYIPANSAFYASDENLFAFERKFKHNTEANADIRNWWILFSGVYGENSIPALGFYVATLFKDHIRRKEEKFPLYNIFGVKGSGKSEMASSMLQLFGDLPVGINMNNGTVPAMADHVAQTANALSHIDEYKNTVDYIKIEFLKGIYDNTGRSRMNMDKDKKKEVTQTDSGVIITGQEMPTADIALFSRCIFTRCSKTNFSKDEVELFNRLKDMQRQGLTNITNQILVKRKEFIEIYDAERNRTYREMEEVVEKRKIEDRIWNNWVMLANTIKALLRIFTIDLSYGYALSKLAEMMKEQQAYTEKGNETGVFWEMVTYLASDNQIEEGYDYWIGGVTAINDGHGKEVRFEIPKKVIAISLKRILNLYTKRCRDEGEKPLPKESLKFYLLNSPEYIGIWERRMKQRITGMQAERSMQDMDNEVQIRTHKERMLTFDYAKLNLELETGWEKKNQM